MARFRDREDGGSRGREVVSHTDGVSLWDACPTMGRYFALQTVQCKIVKMVNFMLRMVNFMFH